MINTTEFLRVMNECKLGPYMGVPCSWLKHILTEIRNTGVEHYVCSEEGSAMGLAAGFSLSGKIPVVYMQTDGVANALNPLATLNKLYNLPCVLLISHRGAPKANDAEQHRQLGRNLHQMLDVIDMPTYMLDGKNWRQSIGKAAQIASKGMQVALIIEKNTFDPIEAEDDVGLVYEYNRVDYMKALNNVLGYDDIVVGTAGFTSREMMEYIKGVELFPMVGSMGCALATGIGLALANKRRVIVLDGDGSILMKPQNMIMANNEGLDNLIHICFDNESYASTGEQETFTAGLEIDELARSCGYPYVDVIWNPQELKDAITSLHTGFSTLPAFLSVSVSSKINHSVPRPQGTPDEWAKEFMRGLKS